MVDGLVKSESRLAAVKRSGLLDSPAEEHFDSLTRLAARLVNVPASFVSIVDAHRDFYKSQTGFPAPLRDERELKGQTFCHLSLASNSPLVIDDTHSSEVWKSVPTVESLGVRAYLGVPLQLDGEIIGSFCVIDTKPRTWQSDEIESVRQLAISATREITLRTAVATAQNEAAQSQILARSREEVMAVVAHDLRTPLQILQVSALMLQKAIGDQHSDITGRMSRAVESITQMANSLLSKNAVVAPSAAGRKTIRSGAFVREAVDMMNPIVERAGMSLVLLPVADAPLHIDFAQMLRVLGNVIGNAVKYSPEGSTVQVSGRRENSLFVISIQDNGKGIDAAGQARAFERGWQGPEGMVRGDGAGLGLSIARTLVGEHGGTIALSSAPGMGTTVIISLPCK